MQFRFGNCTFEPDARRLTRAGRPVPLSPKPLLLLRHLLSRRPSVVSQQEIKDLLWPGTFVGHNNLSQVVSELRRALGSRNRRLVRTAYGAGYAFDGVVLEQGAPQQPTVAAVPGCALHWRSQEIPLREGENVVGRSPLCGCHIASSRVSRRHARIFVRGGQAILEDLGSKNGTYLRDRRVERPTSLASGDVILLGHETVVFSAAGTTDTTETEGP